MASAVPLHALRLAPTTWKMKLPTPLTSRGRQENEMTNSLRTQPRHTASALCMFVAFVTLVPVSTQSP